MKFSEIERGDQQFFCCFQGGIKNLTESFIPFLPPPPPPREPKNDNSLKLTSLDESQFQVVLGMFLNFDKDSGSCSYKIGSSECF